MKAAIWSCCIGMGVVFGFFAGMLVQQTYLTPPPVIYHTPPIYVKPASENCVEQARMCYARKRSAKVVHE